MSRKIRRIAVLVFLFTTMSVSAALLLFKANSDARGKTEYQLIRKIASLEKMEKGTEKRGYLPELPVLDEISLISVNCDYRAWLYIPDIEVSYPVVFPDKNEEYLKKGFSGERQACGCLFFDAGCQPFVSSNTVIHGHNMRSGEMFGCLKKYLDEEYRSQHDMVYVWNKERWIEYKIFSVYLADNSDAEPYRPVHKKNDTKSANDLDTGSILTLSTCHGRKKKLIVQAARTRTAI